jgi:hypothetical protein
MIVPDTMNVLSVQIRNGTFFKSRSYASVVIGSGIHTGGKRKTWPNSFSDVLTIQKKGTRDAAHHAISRVCVATDRAAAMRGCDRA